MVAVQTSSLAEAAAHCAASRPFLPAGASQTAVCKRKPVILQGTKRSACLRAHTTVCKRKPVMLQGASELLGCKPATNAPGRRGLLAWKQLGETSRQAWARQRAASPMRNTLQHRLAWQNTGKASSHERQLGRMTSARKPTCAFERLRVHAARAVAGLRDHKGAERVPGDALDVVLVALQPRLRRSKAKE